MAQLEVIAVGAGDTFSEYLHTSALVVSYDGFRLAIDCPDSYRGVLKKASHISGQDLNLFELDHFLITHVHGDHMNGLEGVAFFKHFAEQKRLHLYASPEVHGVIWEQRLKISMGTLWTGEKFRELDRTDYFHDHVMPWQEVSWIGPFRIRTYRTIHHVPTCALLIEAGGRTLGYSSDTAFDPHLIDFLSEADLIIHETNFGPAHTPYDALLSLPGAIRARMRLIHYSDLFDQESTQLPLMIEGQVVVV